MWEFIKTNKGNKIEHDGVQRAIWLTIEKTTDERLISTKVGYLAKKLVACLADKLKMEQPLAIKCCDADYTRGYVMYLIAEKIVDQADGTRVMQKKSHHIILDSKDRIKYFASDAARELEDLEDVPWGDILARVNGIVTAFSAPAGKSDMELAATGGDGAEGAVRGGAVRSRYGLHGGVDAGLRARTRGFRRR